MCYAPYLSMSFFRAHDILMANMMVFDDCPTTKVKAKDKELNISGIIVTNTVFQ